ncbi:hypothetical protein Tco_0405218 [Tanacetum coccineum]
MDSLMHKLNKQSHENVDVTSSDSEKEVTLKYRQRKTDSSQQGLKFFQSLLEEYYIQHYDQAEENKNVSKHDASFQDAEFIILFVPDDSLPTDPECVCSRLSGKLIDQLWQADYKAKCYGRTRRMKIGWNSHKAYGLVAKVMLRKRVLILKNHLHQCRWYSTFEFLLRHAAHKSFPILSYGHVKGCLNGPMKEEVYVAQGRVC